jgi:hypothetical protein
MCACVGNQQSRGVVITRLQSSVQSLLHQRRDLHQSTYLYLTKDQKPTPYQRRQGSGKKEPWPGCEEEGIMVGYEKKARSWVIPLQEILKLSS